MVSRESAQIQEAAAGQSGGAIQADQAAIQAAKVNLNYTKITSPINGVVGLRQVDPGNIVHASRYEWAVDCYSAGADHRDLHFAWRIIFRMCSI